MTLVWVGIVGRAPHEIAAGVEGSRAAAAAYVALVCLRLFAIAFAIQALFLHFAGWTPLGFVRAATAPALVKKLLVLTLSLIETILHAIDRARTALIAGGIITRRFSWRNLRHGWLLVQTVWLTVVVIAIGRTRDKWPIEGTLVAARRRARRGRAAARDGRSRVGRGRPRVPHRGDRIALNARIHRRREFLRPQRRPDGAAAGARPAFFVGPYAEGALSGLSSTVADEIAIYRAPQPVHAEFSAARCRGLRGAQAADAVRRRAGAARAALLLAVGLCGDRDRHRARTARSGKPRQGAGVSARAEISPPR